MNEDLIGKSFEYLGETWTVTGVASWNPIYVKVTCGEKESVRRGDQLRRMLELS